jgi:long-chain acyl-CoA synthetase
LERPWFRIWPDGVPRELVYPNLSMGEMLRNASSHNPNGTAIVFRDITINYAQLNEYAEKFAAGLAETGVKKGDCVALYLPNTPQFVIGYYGALKLGAIITACSPLYKERELLYQLNDSQAKTILCLTSNCQTVKNVLKDSMLGNVIVADDQDVSISQHASGAKNTSMDLGSGDSVTKFPDLLERAVPAPVDIQIDPSHDLALLQYTGGTTGTPKGAMITHRNLVANAIQFATWLRFRHDDIHLTALPLFHIYGMTTSMNAPIYAASAMIIMPRFEPTQLLQTIDRYKPTVFCGVPTMYTALVNHPETQKHNLRSIRVCISGAAPLPGEVQRKFEQATGGRLVEGYGLTETSPVTHVNPLDDPKKNRIGSIGIPIFDTEAKIVDLETGEKDLTLGEVGELVIRGPQVMQGYWKKPEETEDSLKNGWVHTGDIAKMDEHGYFYIIDRKKDMINVSGLKVYPREVEEILYEHPKVKEACVVGLPDPYRGERVKAFIVLKDTVLGKSVSDELIEFCRQRIADYKAPSEIEVVSQMPKTAAGKIMRRAFREQK